MLCALIRQVTVFSHSNCRKKVGLSGKIHINTPLSPDPVRKSSSFKSDRVAAYQEYYLYGPRGRMPMMMYTNSWESTIRTHSGDLRLALIG
ncbi:hypothetical protein VN97_g9820 [Penicillium thymicola]|uniref:Uncharacterized protein n=1 Tax=Penicillium thymicola TaxID=293382 RepID=A0AAI9TA75_PENTH|nr:hypothetical protein VN97_g9820 [Penicillium thymicola]